MFVPCGSFRSSKSEELSTQMHDPKINAMTMQAHLGERKKYKNLNSKASDNTERHHSVPKFSDEIMFIFAHI